MFSFLSKITEFCDCRIGCDTLSRQRGEREGTAVGRIFQVTRKNYSMPFEKCCTHILRPRPKGISWCVFAIDSHSLLSPLFTFTQQAADSYVCAFLLLSVLALLPLAVQSVIRAPKFNWSKWKSIMVAQNQTGIPFIWTHAGTPSHWPIGTELDSVNATHMLHPLHSLPPNMPSFSFLQNCPYPPPSPSSPSLPFAPAAVNSRIPVCVSVHPSLFSLLSPLHPSIPFFHVCSAVKPSWIRPASLVTCSLCWRGNKQCQTTDGKPEKPMSFTRLFMSI